MARLDEGMMNSSVWRYAVRHAQPNNNLNAKVNNMDQFREDTLKGHVEKCQLRYEYIEAKLGALNDRLTKVENNISTLKSDMQTGFSDIKLLIERQNNARTIQIIATIGTVAAAAIGLATYLIK